MSGPRLTSPPVAALAQVQPGRHDQLGDRLGAPALVVGPRSPPLMKVRTGLGRVIPTRPVIRLPRPWRQLRGVLHEPVGDRVQLATTLHALYDAGVHLDGWLIAPAEPVAICLSRRQRSSRTFRSVRLVSALPLRRTFSGRQRLLRFNRFSLVVEIAQVEPSQGRPAPACWPTRPPAVWVPTFPRLVPACRQRPWESSVLLLAEDAHPGLAAVVHPAAPAAAVGGHRARLVERPGMRPAPCDHVAGRSGFERPQPVPGVVGRSFGRGSCCEDGSLPIRGSN